MKIPPRINAKPVEPEAVVASAALDAEALVACGDWKPEYAEDVRPGAAFRIPVLLPENRETGDRRTFDEGAVTVRDLPIPLYWQIATAQGHEGSVIVGRIDYVERIGEASESVEEDTVEEILDGETGIEGEEPIKGWGNAVGVFDNGAYGREAERLVRGGFLRGISADLDKFEASVELEMAAEGEEEEDDSNKIKNDPINISQARIMAATLLGKPSFQECVLEIIEDEILVIEPLEDGMYEDESLREEYLEDVLLASAAPVVPPAEWFNNPELTKPTPLTVTDEGKVFGHIATFDTNHIAFGNRSVRPPRSRSDYKYFKTGVVRVDSGEDVPVGQLTLAGGHAALTLSAEQAKAHYDETMSAMADVTVGEDRHGIWVSGALRPEATPQQIRAFRASAPSGDWRPINGRLELVAVCQVNVPGFPTPRVLTASGEVFALVAAGSQTLLELRQSPEQALATRLDALEQAEFEKAKAAALQALEPMVKEREAELSAKVQIARSSLEALQESINAELSAKAEKEAQRLRDLGLL